MGMSRNDSGPIRKFWRWYNKNETLNLGLAAFLFTLQLVHLYWLTTHVVFQGLFGKSYFELKGIFETLILVVDYLEIPAILTTSLVYLNEFSKTRNAKNLWFLFFINSQWLHIYWITDEFVIEHVLGQVHSSVLPIWLAWLAIGIDYLELPVIFDTLKKFFNSLGRKGVAAALEEIKERD